MVWWWIGAIAFVAIAAIVVVFNDLVAARNQVRAAWSDIDVQLTRRHDLVPQLVAAVQGYADHERSTLSLLTELRTRAIAAASLADKAQLEGELAQQVQRILALQERYPDLKASENFRDLQNKLVDTENQIQYARRYYNGAVNLLNNRIQRFPDLLIANTFGFKLAEFFDLEDPAAAKSPGVVLG